MKTLRAFLLPFLALLLTFSAYGIPSDINTKATESLRKEIKEKFSKIDIADLKLKDNTVKVQFTVNDKNELIVLRTDHDDLDQLIKNTLNYKTLKTTDLKRNSLYSIKLKLTE